MKQRLVQMLVALLFFVPLAACADDVDIAKSCVEVVLTGTQGGPPAVNGLAGAGTLVRYGSVENQCNDVVLQFDAGRGTTQRLSELGLTPNDLDALFLTHMHSDHTEGVAGLLQLRWHYLGEPLDLICSEDVEHRGQKVSCRAFAEHIGDPFLESGEIALRSMENPARTPGGPSRIVNLLAVAPILADDEATLVWSAGDVRVTARSAVHIAGSLTFRVDTPAGSVVIGGDAGNSKAAPPRDHSTSESVEALAMGADVLVHSAIHSVFAPGQGSKFPEAVYLRQSAVGDLGDMAERAGVRHLVLTHLIPSLGADSHGPFLVPDGPMSEADFARPAQNSGFSGQIHVGKDLMRLRLP